MAATPPLMRTSSRLALESRAPAAGSQRMVVVVEDTSATGAERSRHWLVWRFPACGGKLLEGRAPLRKGKNTNMLGKSEWLLPDVPAGETRHYLFPFFATHLPPVLLACASRAQWLASWQGAITACAASSATFASGAPHDPAWKTTIFE